MQNHTPESSPNKNNPEFITVAKHAVDISHQVFGRLTVLGPIERAKNKQIAWLCLCECGNTCTVQGYSLRSKNTISCGCYQLENRFTVNKTHGLSRTSVYTLWCHIVSRCTNPKNKVYVNYGGRGISISNQWQHSFELFYAYISQLPNFGVKNYTLDRINNDGNYEPDNVRWATWTEQQRNKRNTHLVTYNNETRPLVEWESITGIGRSTLAQRLKLGWSVEKTLTQIPIRRTNAQTKIKKVP